MSDFYRVCPACGHANGERAYACTACRASLNGTVPGSLPERLPVAETEPAEDDPFLLWAAGMEATIPEAETHCHACQAAGSVVRFPFALANVERQFSQAEIFASPAATALLVPLRAGILPWKRERRELALRMNLVLCPECVADRADFYGRVHGDSYRLHPCYAGLEERGFSTFVGEAELEKWGHIQPK